MENKIINCSKKNHEKSDAVTYCKECNIYMCNKCKQYHSDLFDNHRQYPLEKGSKEIFTGICKDDNHFVEYEFFCKSHNKLCCAKCICKFKNKGNGKHGNCDVCVLEDIKDIKKEKLNENIKALEDLSKNLDGSIEKLKKGFNEIKDNKEKLKIKIQTIFTELRNLINKREDELLLLVEKKFKKKYFSEEFLKTSKALPNEVRIALEKGKQISKDWDNNKLNLLINDCLNIEKNIKRISIINDKIKKDNSRKTKIKFYKDDNDLQFYGNLILFNYKYFFRECPKDIDDNKKYEISIENKFPDKIHKITKIGKNSWIGILGENQLNNNINCWKIDICNTQRHSIILGIAPNDFDINSSNYYNCGWYLCLCCGNLFSGPPQNFKNKKIEDIKELFDKEKDNSISLLMDMKEKNLCVLVDNEIKKEIYSNIPTDKPLFPAIFLRDKNDSVKIEDIKGEFIKKKKEEKELKCLTNLINLEKE